MSTIICVSLQVMMHYKMLEYIFLLNPHGITIIYIQ